jgi:hypothetical protein
VLDPETEAASRGRLFVWFLGATVLAALWAWSGWKSQTAEEIRREVPPRWFAAIVTLLAMTLALSRC